MKTLLLVTVVLVVGLSSFSPARAAGANPTIDQAVEAYNSGKMPMAAQMFYQVRMNDTQASNRAQAEYFLAQSLFKMGLFQSALAYYNAVFVAGPAHPYYLKGAEGLIKVAEALKDDTLIPSQINKYYNSEQFAAMDPMSLSRINFNVGMLLYRQEKYSEALAFLGAVDDSSSVYAKSMFLQGIIHIRLGVRYANAREEAKSQEEYDEAIKFFQGTLNLSGGKKSMAQAALAKYDNIQRLWQLCTLNLARSYYGKGDYEKAVMYYNRIPKFSQDWADGLFEIGWAYFMNQDYGSAFGALHTLHSPKFDGMFVPESWILQATLYFHVCLYEEAKAALQYFQDKYENLLPVLKKVTESPLSNEKYASLLLKDTLEAGDPMAEVPVVVRNLILTNPRVGNFRHFLRSLEAEALTIEKIPEWKGSRLMDELGGVVRVQRNLLEKTAGGFVKINLVSAYQTILGFIGHARMITVEIISAERNLVRQHLSVKAGERGKLAPRPKVSDETFNYWPFNGEYWDDELGYFKYTVRKACPVSNKRG